MSTELRGRIAAWNELAGLYLLLAMPARSSDDGWDTDETAGVAAGPQQDALNAQPTSAYAGYFSEIRDRDQFEFALQVTDVGAISQNDLTDIQMHTASDQAATAAEAVVADSVLRSSSALQATPDTDSTEAAGIRADAAASTSSIARPGKIGIGTWDLDGQGTAASDVARLDLGWYYNWSLDPLTSRSKQGTGGADFVPMFWGRGSVNQDNRRDVRESDAKYVLGFNEPDSSGQADLTVSEALKLWPKLMSTGKLLGSPAPTTGEALGEDSWLGRFMARAEKKHLDVDFIAVHYYSAYDDIARFKHYLKAVHEQYDRPVWVTEWALVDWTDHDRFSEDELADFAHDAIQMMDNLGFVKRHAWFAAYTGGDGLHINTELIDSAGDLTQIGHTFADLTI